MTVGHQMGQGKYMKISTKQIAAFIAVADQESFTRAARQLHITQPSLSGLVRDLELILGMPLFDRTTRGATLSAVGRELLPIALRIQDEINVMLSTSTDMSGLLRGKVRTACSTVIASTQLIPIASRFETLFPGIKVEIIDAVEQSLADLVRRQDVDFAVATEVDPEPRIVQTRIGEDHLAVYVPADHRLASQDKVTWKDLEDEPLALLNKGNPIRKLVDRTAGRLGLWLTVTYEVSFGTTALAMADRGLALTILPTNAQQANTTHNCLRKRLVSPSIPRRVIIMSLARRSLSPAAADFQNYCAQEFLNDFGQVK